MRLLYIFIDVLLPQLEELWTGKSYHNTNHVREMILTFVKNYHNIADNYPEFMKDDTIVELLLAIIWHDANYTSYAATNEMRAAIDFVNKLEAMPETLRYFLADDKMRERVVNDILSTRYSNTTYDTCVQKVLHDLDWYYFSSQELLLKAESLILEELQESGMKFSEEAIQARLEFYKDLLGSKRQIFVSRWMEASNKDAEALIKERINALAFMYVQLPKHPYMPPEFLTTNEEGEKDEE